MKNLEGSSKRGKSLAPPKILDTKKVDHLELGWTCCKYGKAGVERQYVSNSNNFYVFERASFAFQSISSDSFLWSLSHTYFSSPHLRQNTAFASTAVKSGHKFLLVWLPDFCSSLPEQSNQTWFMPTIFKSPERVIFLSLLTIHATWARGTKLWQFNRPFCFLIGSEARTYQISGRHWHN